MATTIINQYDRDVQSDKEWLINADIHNPGYLDKVINKSVNMRIHKFLEKMLLSDDISDIIAVLNVNPITVVTKAIGESNNNFPKIKDAFNYIFTNLRPQISTSEYDDDLYISTYKKLREFMKMFINVMEKQLHLIKRDEKNIIFRFFDKVGTKLRTDRLFLVWSLLVLISIFMIIGFEISYKYLNKSQVKYMKSSYEENIYSLSLISSLWLLYNFMFD